VRVAFFFLAEAAQASLDGKINALGAGIESIGSPIFPLVHPQIVVVVKIIFEDAEANKEALIELAFSAKDGSPEIFRYRQAIKPTSANVTAQHSATLILNVIPLTLERPGHYFFDLSVNEAAVETMRLRAVQIKSSADDRNESK